jgi:hypothetical protein
MQEMNISQLYEFRRRTYRIGNSEKIRDINDARNFIDERGFIFFWPISGIDLPSLWIAVAGDRPVADAHDDPGHVTWGWKDDALAKRYWYYAKVIKRKATFISLEIIPYFYALSKNYGSLEEDHLLAYREGSLSLAAKNIYAALLDKGVLTTIDLRKEARLQNAKESSFTKAMEDLQKDFKILPVGISEAGGWRYSYRYDLTGRYFPELPERSRSISESVARSKLIEIYLDSVGAAKTHDTQRLFGWPMDLISRTIEAMIQKNQIIPVLNTQQIEVWHASPDFVNFISSKRK